MRDRYGVDGVRIRLWLSSVPGWAAGRLTPRAVVLALNDLFTLGLSEEEADRPRRRVGQRYGLLREELPQLCTGRGEVMEPFPLDLSGMTLVIVKPDERVSTREAMPGKWPRIPRCAAGRAAARPVGEWQGRGDQRFLRSRSSPHTPRFGTARSNCLPPGRSMPRCPGAARLLGLFAGHGKARRCAPSRPSASRFGSAPFAAWVRSFCRLSRSCLPPVRSLCRRESGRTDRSPAGLFRGRDRNFSQSGRRGDPPRTALRK